MTYFSMFVYIHAHFHFALIGRNLTAQSTGELGVEFKFKFQRRSCNLLSFIFPPRQESLLAGYEKGASARKVKHRKQKIQFGFVTFVFAVTELRNIIALQQHCFLVKLIARP